MDSGLYKTDGLWCRTGTMDEYIVKECRRQYAHLEISPGDRVLDIGANIGAFAAPSARAGATVVAVEPELANFGLLMMNTAGLAVAAERFAVAPVSGTTDLWITPGTNKGHHSLVISKGRSLQVVPALGWAEALARWPSDVLKFDAEGAEYLLDWTQLPASIRRVAIELDLGRKSWRTQAREIEQDMSNQGFRAVLAPKLGENKLWYTMGVWHR